jgi:hypothetical protein
LLLPLTVVGIVVERCRSVATQSCRTMVRQRCRQHQAAREFFDAVVWQAQRRRLLSEEHFTVDGTLLEAAASLKSFKRRDGGDQGPPDDPGNPSVSWRGDKRSNVWAIMELTP